MIPMCTSWQLVVKKTFRRKTHRAVTNMLDFLFALSLFIILMTAFILILIHTSTTVLDQSQIQNNPAELLAQEFLLSPGSSGWAT